VSDDDAKTTFARLAARFAGEPGVAAGTGFGAAPGLRAGGRILLGAGEALAHVRG
jgi:hypothetical protein